MFLRDLGQVGRSAGERHQPKLLEIGEDLGQRVGLEKVLLFHDPAERRMDDQRQVGQKQPPFHGFAGTDAESPVGGAFEAEPGLDWLATD